jgi:hypothetical protein
MEEIKTHFTTTYGEEYMSYYTAYETHAVSEGTTNLDQFISYFRDNGKTLTESLDIGLEWYDYCQEGSTSEINVEEFNNAGIEDKFKLITIGDRVYKQRWLTHPDSNITL